MAKFNVKTDLLKNSLNLIVKKEFISIFYRASSLLQLQINEDRSLVLNTVSSNVKSEVKLLGGLEGDAGDAILVDAVLFDSIIGTITEDEITMEFVDSGIELHTVSANYKVAQIMDAADIGIERPNKDIDNGEKLDISDTVWQNIHKNLTPILGINMSYPIYNNVWLGENGDIIAGDFSNELFAKQSYSEFGLEDSCLFTPPMIAVLCSKPEGGDLYRCEIDEKIIYTFILKNDNYTYSVELQPLFESDESVGNYHADDFMALMDVDKGVKLSQTLLLSCLQQAKIFTNPLISLKFDGNRLDVSTSNIKRSIDIDGELNTDIMEFKVDVLANALNRFSDSEINIGISERDDKVVGLNMWDESLHIIVGRG